MLHSILLFAVLVSTRTQGMGGASLAMEDLLTDIRHNPCEATRIEYPSVFVDVYSHYFDGLGRTFMKTTGFDTKSSTVVFLPVFRIGVIGVGYNTYSHLLRSSCWQECLEPLYSWERSGSNILLAGATELRGFHVGATADFPLPSHWTYEGSAREPAEPDRSNFKFGIGTGLFLQAQFNLVVDIYFMDNARDEMVLELRHWQELTERIGIGVLLGWCGDEGEIIDLLTPTFGLGSYFSLNDQVTVGVDYFSVARLQRSSVRTDSVLIGVEAQVVGNLVLRVSAATEFGYPTRYEYGEVGEKWLEIQQEFVVGLGYSIKGNWVFDYAVCPSVHLLHCKHFIGVTYNFE